MRQTLLARRTLLATASVVMSIGGTAAAADRFAALEASSGGRIGVAGVDTGSGATVAHRADERFPFCSTFKLVAASALLRRSQTETDLLEKVIAYSESDLAPYSPVTSKHAGAGMTVAGICAAALQYSDNTAANLMIRLLGGPEAVTAFARSNGDEAFRLDRWETALNSAIPGDPRDTSTPIAMMTDLRRATLGDLLGEAEQTQLVAWMRGCMTGLKRIRSVAPEGAVVADKTGTGDNGTANDIAVIWPPGKAPVVLAVYVTGQTSGAADAVVAAAAKIALDSLG